MKGKCLAQSVLSLRSQLRNMNRSVTKEEGEALAKKLRAGFIESSAKDNANVCEYILWTEIKLSCLMLANSRCFRSFARGNAEGVQSSAREEEV